MMGISALVVKPRGAIALLSAADAYRRAVALKIADTLDKLGRREF